MRPNQTNYRNLNREGRWPDFHWSGLQRRPDGALQLCSVPLLEGGTPAAVTALAAPNGPAGVALGPDGTIYFSDPQGDRIWSINPCDKHLARFQCVDENGDKTPFQSPRGLLVHSQRAALLVADSGLGRIGVFDLDSGAQLDRLGEGGLKEPWSIAADGDGNIYVADYATRSVVKLAITSDPIPTFWQNVEASGLLTQPAAVAVWSNSLFVLDSYAKQIFEFHLDGQPVLDNGGVPVAASWTGLQQPMGLAADSTHLWVGDNTLRRVLQFERGAGGGFAFTGEAVGYQGPVAALLFDPRTNQLLVAGGSSLPPVALSIGEGFGARGVLWSDRLTVSKIPPKWHRLLAAITPGDSEAHLQFFIRTSNDPAPPTVDPTADPPFPPSQWRTIPYDIGDTFLGGPPQLYLWVGAVLLGDQVSSPALSQIRVEYNHDSYLLNLPEIYREASPCGDFLLRFLSLFESFFDEPEAAFADMPRLFDPQTAPSEFLPWLAGWLALDLPGDLDEAGRRNAISRAFSNYALRGTPRGLQQAVQDSTGLQVMIEEPILNAAWWRLPTLSRSCPAPAGGPVWQNGTNSVLGFSTGLASSAPQGAVIGTTSVLDQARLTTDDQLGAPLFEAFAYQFSVLVYRGEIECAGKLEAITAVVEREKPAHTLYHICVVEPQMRVGFQSRLGIDTVVAGPSQPTRLGLADGASTSGLVLAGKRPGLIGQSRVGENTWL